MGIPNVEPSDGGSGVASADEEVEEFEFVAADLSLDVQSFLHMRRYRVQRSCKYIPTTMRPRAAAEV